MIEKVIIISIIACWIGEWSKLIQNISWFFRLSWIDYWFGCAKCWAFWIGLYYGWTYRFSEELLVLIDFKHYRFIIFAIICSAIALVFNKIYMRL